MRVEIEKSVENGNVQRMEDKLFLHVQVGMPIQ